MLGKVSIAIEAAMASFESDMGRAARIAEKNTKRMERDFQRLEQNMKRVGKVVGAAIATGLTAAAYAIKGVINDMDDMSKAAQRANMPTEDFSRLAYAGSLADVSIQDLEKSMGKLAKAQGDAAQGLTTQVRGFEALGIAFKNADGSLRSTTDVFLDFADVFQKNQGSPEIMALGMQVFGRSFQNLIPLMKDGRAGLQGMFDESDRLGKTLDGETGRAAENFNDNLTRLNTRFTALKQEIAVQLLPTLINLSEEFLESSTEGDGLATTAERIGKQMSDAAIWVANIYDRLVILRGEMVQLQAAGQGLNPFSRLRSFFDDGEFYAGQVKAAEQAAKDVEAARARIAGRNSPFFGVTGSARGSWERPKGGEDPVTITAPTKSGPSEADREAEKLLDLYNRQAEGLSRQIALYGQTSEAVKIRYEIENGELAKLTEVQQQDLEQKAKALDLRKADAEAYEKSMRLAQEEADAILRRAENQSRMIDDMQFELSLYGLSNIERQKAIALRHAEADAASAQGQAITDLVERMEMAREAEQYMDGLKGAFVDFGVEALSSFDSIADAAEQFAERIKRMALQLLVEKSVQWLFGLFMGGGQAAPSQEFAYSFGNNTGWLGGGRARGGPVSGSKLYEVGEGGRPELFQQGGRTYLIPGNAGQVVPAVAGGIGGGGGGVEVNIINNSGAPARTKESTGTDGRRLIEVVIGAVADDMSRGGRTGKAMEQIYGLQRQGVSRG